MNAGGRPYGGIIDTLHSAISEMSNISEKKLVLLVMSRYKCSGEKTPHEALHRHHHRHHQISSWSSPSLKDKHLEMRKLKYKF